MSTGLRDLEILSPTLSKVLWLAFLVEIWPAALSRLLVSFYLDIAIGEQPSDHRRCSGMRDLSECWLKNVINSHVRTSRCRRNPPNADACRRSSLSRIFIYGSFAATRASLSINYCANQYAECLDGRVMISNDSQLYMRRLTQTFCHHINLAELVLYDKLDLYLSFLEDCFGLS